MRPEYIESAKARFSAKTRVVGDCHLWTAGTGNGGYGVFHFGDRNQSAHRVSYMLFKGEIPSGLCVMHSCDNRLCVNPEHLSLGTHLQNTADMNAKGRGNKAAGRSHHLAKLTPEIAAEIRRRYVCHDRKNGASGSALAREFGVSAAAVQTLLRGETWKI